MHSDIKFKAKMNDICNLTTPKVPIIFTLVLTEKHNPMIRRNYMPFCFSSHPGESNYIYNHEKIKNRVVLMFIFTSLFT